MENLTTCLLVKHYHYEIEEWTKQGQGLQFDSGKEQRIVSGSIPSIELTISYRGLKWNEYEALRTAYEDNNSNTFILDMNEELDKRPDLMGINSSVWVFKEFIFNINAKENLYKGQIKLVTSVFFNYTAYQELYNQSSSYLPTPSTDESFINVLEDVRPHTVESKFVNNALFSSIGQSARHIKNKGGLKRIWTLHWLLQESDFLKLLLFNRKKSGIMGEFGIYSDGSSIENNNYFHVENYVENYIDYPDWYLLFFSDIHIQKARFMQDSFKYQKRLDGLFTAQVDILEIK